MRDARAKAEPQTLRPSARQEVRQADRPAIDGLGALLRGTAPTGLLNDRPEAAFIALTLTSTSVDRQVLMIGRSYNG